MEEDEVFLKSVLDYVSHKPIILPRLIAVLTQGLSSALDAEKDKRLNTEIALVALLTKKSTKAGTEFLIQKLAEIQPHAFFNYEKTISELNDHLSGI
jgi:hypothetical protein